MDRFNIEIPEKTAFPGFISQPVTVCPDNDRFGESI